MKKPSYNSKIIKYINIVNYQLKIGETLFFRLSNSDLWLSEDKTSKQIIDSLNKLFEYFANKKDIAKTGYDRDISDIICNLFSTIYALSLMKNNSITENVDNFLFNNLLRFNLPRELLKNVTEFFVKITKRNNQEIHTRLSQIPKILSIIKHSDVLSLIKHNKRLHESYNERESYVPDENKNKIAKKECKLLHELPTRLIKEAEPIYKCKNLN